MMSRSTVLQMPREDAVGVSIREASGKVGFELHG